MNDARVAIVLALVVCMAAGWGVCQISRHLARTRSTSRKTQELVHEARASTAEVRQAVASLYDVRAATRANRDRSLQAELERLRIGGERRDG